MKSITLVGSVIFALLSVPVLASPIQGQGDISYRNDVFPILHDYCLNCPRAGRQGL